MYQAPHTRGVLALPPRIDRKWHVHRPAGHGAAGKFDCIPNRLVSAAAAIEHSHQHSHVEIGVVVHAHFAFADRPLTV